MNKLSNINRRIALIVFSISLIFAGGCKKTELTGEYSDYVGEWKRGSTTIVFKPDGKADYDEFGAGLFDEFKNARVIIDGSMLTLRKGFAKKEFIINMPPSPGSGTQWEMTLNNATYRRN